MNNINFIQGCQPEYPRLIESSKRMDAQPIENINQLFELDVTRSIGEVHLFLAYANPLFNLEKGIAPTKLQEKQISNLLIENNTGSSGTPVKDSNKVLGGDTLAKPSSTRKKVMIAAAILVGIVAIGVLAYLFAPAVMGAVAKMTPPQALVSMCNAVKPWLGMARFSAMGV